jgi:signal recognition particle GTPase
MGFFEKKKNGLAKTRNDITSRLVGIFDSFTGANEDFFEELEETLILADWASSWREKPSMSYAGASKGKARAAPRR